MQALGDTIGVDLGGTKILAGRVRADGGVVDRREVPTDVSSGARILAQITALVAALAGGTAVAGVGVGMPGTVDQRSGVLVQAVNLPLHEAPVRDELGRSTGLPVAIDNDANCAALAEHVYGAAGPYGTSVMLTLGTGVGGGAILNGVLYRGATGGAGELGHIVVDPNGPRCQGSCPGRGHLEVFCSGTAVTAATAEHLAAHPEGTLARRAATSPLHGAHLVLAAAEDGDAEAAGLLERLAYYLGLGLATLAHAFEPDVFVIGGGFGDAVAPWVIEPARHVLRTTALEPMCRAEVVPASLGAEAGMIGASALLRG